MALETGDYVSALVAANPASGDLKSQGDDHLRLIKTALKTSFAGFDGAIVLSGADTGTVNNYALTPSPELPAYVSKMMVLFTPAASNTTGSTLDISRLGAKTIKTVSGDALSSGDLVAGALYLLAYDGTDFRIVTGPTKNYVDQLSFSSSLPSQTGNGGKYLKTDGTNAAWGDPYADAPLTGTPTAPTAAVDTSTTQIATTAFVVNQAYAKLASPTFTGNVTVPTLAADVASAYAVNAAWYAGQQGTASPQMDGAATAGTSKKWTPIDHVHPTDTSRAPLASPTFTGTPAAPTAAAGTNTTQLATTAFVVAEIANKSATQAEMEAASSTSVVATPGNMKWHPGVTKVQCAHNFDGSTVYFSSNISSVTENLTGDFTYAFSTGFSSNTAYGYQVHAVASGVNPSVRESSKLASYLRVVVVTSGPAGIEPDAVYLSCFGDQ